MNIIQSRDNNLIKKIKKLKEKKYREESDMFLIEGFRFVLEALKSSFEVKYVFVSEKVLDKWKDMCLNINFNFEKCIIVSEQILKLISNTDNPQGIVAVVKNKKVDIQDKEGVYILVDKVQDPGNMGTIIRTAHAINALGVIVTKGTVDIYNDKTLRSTMGSIFNVPIILDSDLSFVNTLKQKNFKLLVSYLDNESLNFYDIELPKKLIITVGNEGNGISSNLVNCSDLKVKIPMPGGSESLNVSVAASVMMYEFLRQNI